MKRLIIAIVCMCSLPLFANNYERAYESYQKGEAASTIEEREDYFNEALQLYTEDPLIDGKLYFNIANCYYQLNQMGMAIWYYHKAESLLPRDDKIKENFMMAQSSAGLCISSWERVKKQIFFFHHILTPSEKSLALIFFSLLSFATGSYFLWRKKNTLKYSSLAAFIICALLGGSLFMGEQSSKEGIFIQPSLLRCDAGMQYKEVGQGLIKAGEKFKVLEISKDQQWLRVKVQSGKKGYVSSQQVRFF